MTNKNESLKRFYKTSEVCEVLGVTRGWIWEQLQIEDGDFPRPFKFGRLSRFSIKDIQEYIDKKAKDKTERIITRSPEHDLRVMEYALIFIRKHGIDEFSRLVAQARQDFSDSSSKEKKTHSVFRKIYLLNPSKSAKF